MDSSTSAYRCDDDTDILLVTANVGSLFEDPLRLLRPWLVVFLQKVIELQPKFLALHLQEVGGKTYEKSMEYVQEFIRNLCEAPQMLNFEFIRIYMDEDFNSAEHFTALGNLYFVHNSLKNVKMWNFLTHNWESADGKNIYSGNIETISSKEKSKFPQHFFPECKWSRKGYMRTRWELNKTVFDLVNIHLFHDASNLAACEEFPSVYCKTRRRALVHTLERFHLDEKNGLAPFFVFGDFNFRCDTEGVIKAWSHKKTQIKKKLSINKRESRATGGGPHNQLYISGTDEAIAKLCGLYDIVDGIDNSFSYGFQREEENIEQSSESTEEEVHEEQLPTTSTLSKKRKVDNHSLQYKLKKFMADESNSYAAISSTLTKLQNSLEGHS